VIGIKSKFSVAEEEFVRDDELITNSIYSNSTDSQDIESGTKNNN